VDIYGNFYGKISAINLKEIEVKFNKEVDEDNLGTYKLDKAELSEDDDVTLLEDGKTVRITFDVAKPNQKSYKLSIEGTKDTDGKELVAVTKDVTMLDITLPLIEKVEAKGNKRITITFSEPMKADASSKTYASYKIDGKLVVGSGLPEVNGRKISLNLAKALDAGEHELVIVPNKLSDYNNLKIAENTTKFIVVEDKVAPTFSIKSTAQEKVTLQFDEEIDINVLKVYWKNGNVKNYATISKDTVDSTVVYAKFSKGSYIPLTETTLYVENATDYSGNIASTSEIKVIASADVVRPAVESVTSEKETEITVTFTKNINDTTGSYIVKDAKGRVVSYDSKAYARTKAGTAIKNKIILTKTAGFDTATLNPYTVTIEKVKDLSALENESLQQVFSVIVQDKKAPTVTTVTKTTDGNNIAITFSEKVDPSTATDPANYAYLEPGIGYVAFPQETVFTALSDGKSILITLPAAWKFNNASRTINNITGTSAISIKNVADLAGNVMFAQLAEGPADELAAKVMSAEAIDKNTIVLQLSQDTTAIPTTVWAGDFVVKNSASPAVSLTVTEAVISSAKRTITLTVKEDMTSTAKFGTVPAPISVSMAQNVEYTKTALGTILTVDSASKTVADGISASVKENGISVDDNKVTIKFDENIKCASIISGDPALAKVLVVKDSDGNRLIPGTDFDVAKGADDLTITVKKANFTDTLTISLDSIYLTDGSNNNINAFSVNTGNVEVNGAILTGRPAETPDATFTVTSNIGYTLGLADIDMDNVTAANNDNVIINGVKYTVAVAEGKATVTATGSATAKANATTNKIVITDSVTKASTTLTLNIAAVEQNATPSITITK
jgi:hypothetical protein